jgi:hypothetical protein
LVFRKAQAISFLSFHILSSPTLRLTIVIMNNDHNSNNTVYTAVPLSPPSNEGDEETSSRTTDDEILTTSTSSITRAAQRHSAKLFFFGMLTGLACYCLLGSLWLPSFSLVNQNILGESWAKILLYITFTGLWNVSDPLGMPGTSKHPNAKCRLFGIL